MRRRSNKDALIDGAIGAAVGALNFKLSEMTRQQMEQAELRKEQRLAAIRAAETEAAQQFQMQRDQAGFAHQSQLSDKQIAAQAERDRVQGQQRMAELRMQGDQQMRVVGAQGANSIAAARAGQRDEIQTYMDDRGQYVQIPLNAAGQQQLNTLQSQGRKLQLVEGSRGGRYSELSGGLMGGGAPAGNGAGSRPAPAQAPNFVWDPEQQRLVPAGN